MKNYNKSSEDISFVAVGSLNPLIFHPEWFLRHGFITKEETEQAEIEIVHADVCRFKTSWFLLEVVQTRLVLRITNESRADDLRDMICNIFNVLGETPVAAIGLNREMRYSCVNEEVWHLVGNTLAPKDTWLRALPGREEKEVGMRSVEIELQRSDELKGHIRVNVFPSNYPPNQEVTFKINDHIQINDPVSFDKSIQDNPDVKVSEIVAGQWDIFLKTATDLVDALLSEIQNG